MSPIASGERRHLVYLFGPSVSSVPDGDGGYVPGAPVALEPASVFARIAAASAADLERIAGGTVLAQAALILTMPFHPEVTTDTRVAWTDGAGRSHTASVTGAVDPDSTGRELIVGVVEVVE